MGIIENYKIIRKEIEKTADEKNLSADDIKIIAVSKTHPVETLQEAINSGIPILGENKIQEAKTKFPQLAGDFEFHFIGHLQSNKSKEAVKFFDLIHSIDKASTAEKVNSEAKKIDKIQRILVQVNSSKETAKSGVEPDKLLNLIEDIADLENVQLCGLMTMAPFTSDETIIRDCFKLTHDLLLRVNDELKMNLKELSMGMSSDYLIAIEEGSTMVRIGTAIFGNRNYI